MRLQPENDVNLTHGGNIVRLVPSFRAAVILEQRKGGFVALLQDLNGFKLQTIHAIILASATDADAANRLIQALGTLSLRRVREITLQPLVTLISRLLNNDSDATTAQSDSTSKPIAWADYHRDLFKLATGWLGWTPDQTYHATIPEISLALEGHIDLLKATHGAADDDTSNTDAQRQTNIAAGLDPDFDREGLASLRGMGGAL